MSVKIRMKKLGRSHRPFFRICAIESRKPRHGKVLEELGTYDPMLLDTDARAQLNGERIAYWLSVGAQPSDKVGTLIKKYGERGTHLAQQEAALARLAEPKSIPDPGAPASVAKKPEPEAPPEAETPAAEATEAPAADESTEVAAEAAPEKVATEEPAAEAATETPAAKATEEKKSGE